MAESETPKKDVRAEVETEEPLTIESQIGTAMRSRVLHFKEQADSLTFEGVRRLLEKDLGLEEYALDVHKRFIKQCLLKCLEGVTDDDTPKISVEAGEKDASTQETEGSTEEHQPKKDVKDHCAEDEDKMEDSPVLGLLKDQKAVKLETKEDKDNERNRKVVPSETLIKKAIRKRAPYIRANSEKVTMAGLRRLLEEDLNLDKFTLDPCKKFISQQLDEVLNSSEVSEPAKNAKKVVKKKPDTKATKKISSEEENSETSDKESDEEDEVKHRKKVIPKVRKQTAEPKKRKGPPEETNLSSKKRAKLTKAASEENSDTELSGKNSEDDQSHSSPEKPAKKKEASTAVYGKRVEHLKSVIKACGMSVPPVIYKKVKQAPENKREAQLIKELEEILSREGLSSDPSEKEIKEVRRKKERAKELEGIDLSNIVSSSRRRSVTSFAPPPKPKIPVETNSKDAEDNDDDNDDEDNNEEEDEEDEEEDGSDADGSQSDEFNEDEEDSD